ncbi:MAG: tyrosine-type recombinase/integrase [Lachnospiraceae bacterium]|nr:tyrosine-type recombinase/integrase [Lachnospiraceae bacterium]
MDTSKMRRNIKGQGCFVTLENGRILYRKSAGYTSEGKRKILTVRANSKAVCIQLMKEKEAAWQEEQERTSPALNNTVVELCEKHLAFQVDNGELKPKSIDRREDTIRNQIGKYPLGHMQIHAITPADIEQHISTLMKEDLSVSSIKKALDVLNAAYEWATVRGDIKSNPVIQIKRSIHRRLSKLETRNVADADVIVLSPDEEDRFLKECLRKNENNGEYKYAGGLYGSLLLHTGMRVGEMISLKWSDYDEDNGLLTISKSTSVTRNRDERSGKKYVAVLGTTKNQKARVIQLMPEAIEDLKLIHRQKTGRPDDLICRTKTGRPYTATMMEHCMETIYRNMQCDTKVSGLHIFRRTFATRMYENGADVKEIAAYIGDLESTTMRYYIAARKKMKVGDSVTQVVPLPGKRKVPTSGEDS